MVGERKRPSRGAGKQKLPSKIGPKRRSISVNKNTQRGRKVIHGTAPVANQMSATDITANLATDFGYTNKANINNIASSSSIDDLVRAHDRPGVLESAMAAWMRQILQLHRQRTTDELIDALMEEYNEIVKQEEDQPHVGCNENPEKNRFRNVPCWDKTRVKLDKTGKKYIHANFIDWGDNYPLLIVTQGPLKDTVVDFYRMLWVQKATVIVMLCDHREEGKGKSEPYFGAEPGDVMKAGPEDDERYEYDIRTLRRTEATVELGNQTREKIWVSELELTRRRVPYAAGAAKDASQRRLLVHYQIISWPDRFVPECEQVIPALHAKMLATHCLYVRKNGLDKEVMKEGAIMRFRCPIVIHCSAGVGRSGTFVAALLASRALVESQGKVALRDIVKRLRSMRAHAVQNPAQYVFIVIIVLSDFARLFLRPNNGANSADAQSIIAAIQALKDGFRRRFQPD